nr:nitroreductase/quinone reductase family protein [Pseudoalteromonas sp. OOF1S-7]
MAKLQVFVYRKTGGRLMNTFMGAPVAILTTVGHKSGAERHTPLIYIEDKEYVVITPTKLGMRKPPVWQLNVEKQPNVSMQIGSLKRKMLVTVADENEEKKYWPKLIEVFSEYENCLSRAEGVRKIPLYVLKPVE